MIGTPFQQEVLKRLSELSPVYIVGGAVRDAQLGIPSNDVDAVTALPLQQIEENLANWGYSPHVIGAHQPTVSLFREKERVDISVFSGEVETDALRRDFTLNAIYQDVMTGQIKDPLSGLQALREKRLRACGRAQDRFKEDPLRILRLVRLAIRYDLEIEQETWQAAYDNLSLLQGVSVERVTEEFGRILILKEIDKALVLLDDLGYIKSYIPELARLKGLKQNPCPTKDAWEHTRQVVKNAPPRVLLRLAALFLQHEKERAYLVKRVLSRFRWSMVLPGGSKGERELHFLVGHHGLGTSTFMSELKGDVDKTKLRTKARRFAWEIGWDGQTFKAQRVEDLLDLWRADFLGSEQEVERNQNRLNGVQEEIRQACAFLTERACLLDWRFFEEFAHEKGLVAQRFGQFKEQVRKHVMINDKIILKDLRFLEREYEIFRNNPLT